jgi:hypothetical protein
MRHPGPLKYASMGGSGLKQGVAGAVMAVPLAFALALVLATAALAIGPAAASAEALSPWWGISSGSQPTNLVSGEAGQIVVTAQNRGDASTSGVLTIVDRLPAGLTATAIEAVAWEGQTGNEGHDPVTCTLATLTCNFGTFEFGGQVFPESLPPYEVIEVRIAVAVEPGAHTGETNTASVSGGGAAGTRTATHAIEVNGSEKFGVEDYELVPENSSGAVDTRAGSHPFQLTSVVTLNTTTPEPETSNEKAGPRTVGLAKDVVSELPAGLIADPASLPQCSEAQFFTQLPTQRFPINECPGQSTVGVATLTLNARGRLGLETITSPIFDMAPVPGEPARFGIDAQGIISVFLGTGIRTGGDYGVTLSANEIIQAAWLVSLKLTFWGVPGDARHDSQRGWECLDASGACPGSTATNPPPLLSLPSTCQEPWVSTLHADSWASEEHPSDVAEPFTYALEAGGHPLELDSCNQLPFAPEITATPERAAASTPSGLDVDVQVPQSTATDSEDVTESMVRDITIALPEGMTLNPAGAGGLEACSESQIGFAGFQDLDSGESSEAGVLTPIFTSTLPEPLHQGVNFCPDAAKIGTVKLKTPLLTNPLEGFVYLAAQGANPFGSLVAAYLVAKDRVSGVLVKLPGALSLNPQTGQITATFQNTPQLPIEQLDIDFFGGERALLATPAHCGSYTTTASVAPWSGNPPADVSSTFAISSGPEGTAGGSTCPFSSLPFDPTLTGGMTNLNAGAFSSLTVTLSRADGQQSLEAFTLRLPAGVSGMLSSVPLCPEAQANAGACPATSQVGETVAAAGLGGDPYPVTGGKVYLTAGYEAAPFGLAIVTPVKAGPFDLQNAPENHPACDCLVIRAAIEVDPQTAQLTIVSGAIPSIIDGVPLQIKQLNITIGRAGFIFNPTSCAPVSIAGTVTGGEGAASSVSAPFQLANCRNLALAPKLTASTRANGELLGHGASLHLVITTPPAGQANMRSLKLDLPQRLPARLETTQRACPEKTFDQNPAACPKASVVGSASVRTPILATTMTGPAYLVSKTGAGATHPGESKTEKEEAAFPDLVLVLQGQGVRIDLTGGLFVSTNNITSVAFRSIPDVPIRRLDLYLPEGKTSILAASSGLCTKKPLRMTTAIVAQDGARAKATVRVSVEGCGHKRPAPHRAHQRSGKKRS